MARNLLADSLRVARDTVEPPGTLIDETAELPAVDMLAACLPVVLTLPDRVEAGFRSERGIVGKVWSCIVAGIGTGAGIHGYVPEGFMACILGRQAWWVVPLAVLVGEPMHTNVAGVIPNVQALLAKGAALGTVLALMMSVIARSLPEMIILPNVLKPWLIATFAGIVAAGLSFALPSPA